jgi:hypothetical protein
MKKSTTVCGNLAMPSPDGQYKCPLELITISSYTRFRQCPTFTSEDSSCASDSQPLPFPTSLDHASGIHLDFIAQAASFDVHLLCFPEAYLPGMRGQNFSIPLCEQAELREALTRSAKKPHGTEWASSCPWNGPRSKGRYNLVQVISPEGHPGPAMQDAT